MYITDRNNLRHRQPTRPDHRLQRQSGQGRHRDRAGQVHRDCSGHRSDAKLAGYHYGGGPGRYRLRLGRGCERGQEGDVHGRTHSGGYLLKPDRIAMSKVDWDFPMAGMSVRAVLDEDAHMLANGRPPRHTDSHCSISVLAMERSIVLFSLGL
jgi:hypothetical protein